MVAGRRLIAVVAVCAAAPLLAVARPVAASPPPPPDDGDDAAAIVALYGWFAVIDGGVLDQYTALYDDGREDEIAECMAESGFTYTPQIEAVNFLRSDPYLSMSSEDYAHAYGFGIAAGPLGLVPEPQAENANAGHLESLSEGQQEAWSVQHDRCVEEVYGDRDDEWDRQQAFSLAATEFKDWMYARDDYRAVRRAWQECLAASGFEFEYPEQMRLQFLEQMTEIAPSFQVQEGNDEYAEMEALFASEREAAIANVPCEATYRRDVRSLIADHIGTFWEFFETATTGE